MKFLNKLNQKNLAKAIVCSLLVSGGIFVDMGQAEATYMSGTSLEGHDWVGTNVTFSEKKIGPEYNDDRDVRGISQNNTLNVDGVIRYPIHALVNFQNFNFYINDTKNLKYDIMISPNHFTWESIKNVKVYALKSADLKVGDEVFLLYALYDNTSLDNNSGDNEEKISYGAVAVSDFQDIVFDVWRDKHLGLMAQVKSIKSSSESNDKSPIETQAAGLTMLTTGADMLAGQGFNNAASAVASEVREGGSANSMTPFVTVGGAKNRVNSGSHVDVKGWHLNAGLAKELKNKAGKLLIGPVVEYGKGTYDSYLYNGFHGEGDTHYIGGGVMAKQTNDNGFYYEGSLRAGKLSNDYKSQEISLNTYDSDSTYYAAHVGLGKIVKLSEKNSLDYYGKYFYTHQKSDDTVLYSGGAKYDLHLVSVDSNRTKLGARFTHALNEKNSIYAGLAWQHEFSGTTRATMDSVGTPAPSIKGNTGIMELGCKVEAGKKLDLDLNATGYTGKQKGASLNLNVNFKF